LLVFVVGGLAGVSCRRAPASPEERLQLGKQQIQRVSDTLGRLQAFSVTTQETRERIGADGKPARITLTRQTIVRRPDRLHFKTTGDVQNEAWYDGRNLTLASHKEKVFAQAPMPETLDRTLDAIAERYGIPLPLGDLLYTSPAHALIADTTTGGWVGRERVGDQDCDHVVFQDKGVNWELWIDANGLPRRAQVEYPNTRRLRRADVLFTDWNLSPTIEAKRFDPAVPAGYEGIAMIQREAALRNVPSDAAPTGDKK
jgi:hypothetical protein